MEAAKAGGVKVVGQAVPHLAGAKHTTGEAEYTDDTPLPPGTLHGWPVRALVAPATLTKVDASVAKASPGVEGVFFAADLPEGGLNSYGGFIPDEVAFADGAVLHVGQVIGLAVATTAEEARVAAERVVVEYGPPPEGVTPVYTIEDAIAAGSYYPHPFDLGCDLEHGPSVEAAMKEPGVTVVRGEFCCGGQDHFFLEAHTSLVTPKDDGGLDIVMSSQNLTSMQQFVSRVTGVAHHKIVAKCRRMGGAFGGKETRCSVPAVTTAVAALHLNRPVRTSMRRDVNMTTSGGRHPFLSKYAAAAKIDPATGKATLVALDIKTYCNGGAFCDYSPAIMGHYLLSVDNCYKWPSFRVFGVCCKTHKPPNTAFRGFGVPQAMITIEHIIEHLATELKVPSHALRSSNFLAPGDEIPCGQFLDADDWRIPRAWAELSEQADYEARLAAVAEFNAAHKWRKRGLSMVPTKYGMNLPKFMSQGGSLVHLYQDGSVLITHGGTEMGQGLHTKVCQVAARAFGVPLSKCHVAETATDKVANTISTAGSMSTELYGMATLDACRQILARLKPLREGMPNASIAELATVAFFSRIDLSAHGFFVVDESRVGFDFAVRPGTKPDGTPDQAARGVAFNYFTQGVACVEVEVDVLTGDHEVLRADLLVDLGSSINPALDIGQIEGAFTQGMGWCTTEEIIVGDSEHEWVKPAGRQLTQGPGAYKIPAFNDVPRVFNVRLMSGVENKVAIHSSKAVGEPPFFLGCTTFFAIRQAVAAARADHLGGADDAPTGVLPHISLYSPATSERIRMACGDKFAVRAIGDDEAAKKAALLVKASY